MKKLYKKAVIAQIKKFNQGNFRWVDEEDSFELVNNHDEEINEIKVLDQEMYACLAKRGGIGLGESFARGMWATSNLRVTLTCMARNIDAINKYEQRKFLQRAFLKIFHYGNRNNKKNSKLNIRAHYDLGNKFFNLFLDKEKQYSCLLFKTINQSLDEAADNKLNRIIKLLDPRPGQRILEVGCGWGALTLRLAKDYKAKVTAITLSKELYDDVKQKVDLMGLQNNVEVLLKDYRSYAEGCNEKFDRIVSIEMIEAVGAKYMPVYFKSISKLIKKDGLFVMQAITIKDQHFEVANKEVDFIKRYIFPGGFLPSTEKILNCIKSYTTMTMLSLDDYTASYTQTLQHWSDRLQENSAKALELGYDEQFQRLWQFYFAYCQAGFTVNHTGLVQCQFAGPDYKRVLA